MPSSLSTGHDYKPLFSFISAASEAFRFYFSFLYTHGFSRSRLKACMGSRGRIVTVKMSNDYRYFWDSRYDWNLYIVILNFMLGYVILHTFHRRFQLSPLELFYFLFICIITISAEVASFSVFSHWIMIFYRRHFHDFIVSDFHLSIALYVTLIYLIVSYIFSSAAFLNTALFQLCFSSPWRNLRWC